jgi:phosphopantothenoylcysteine decarboxylase/phosphopantothenate--cysteine ligase
LAGNLACGETGAGRLIEPETMLAHLQTYFLQKTEPKRILVTAGGTTEPIDPVRSIINFSTGETGFRIAQTLCNLGHDVTLVQSVHSRFADRLPKIVRYNTTKEFGEIFENKLKNNFFDVLIHSAAVADYSVENVAHSKIQGSAPLTLTLKPNPKYIARARDWSKNKKLKIISFKLTSGENDLKLSSYDSEYILHNELSEVGSQNHEGTLYERNADGNYSAKQTLKTKDELVTLIGNLVES